MFNMLETHSELHYFRNEDSEGNEMTN